MENDETRKIFYLYLIVGAGMMLGYTLAFLFERV